jgi:phage terminase large subunit-like protein
VQVEFYADECQKARAVPAEENAFRTFYLSQWVGQETRYIPMEHWAQCETATSAPAKRLAFGGLDLSATTDLTAFSVVAQNADGTLDLFSYPFLPAEGLQDRERRDRAPYGQWAKEGWLTLTPGRVIDYQAVKAKILEASEQFELRDIGYDRWGSAQLVQELEAEGMTVVRIGQGHKDMSAPTKEFLKHTLAHDFHTGGDPLLKWTVGNFAVTMDPAENVKPDKAKATQRIDPVVASIMAVDGWERRGKAVKKASAYSSGFYAQFMPTNESAVTVP